MIAEWGLLDVCNGWRADDRKGALERHSVCFSNVRVHTIARLALDEKGLFRLLDSLPRHEAIPLTDAIDDYNASNASQKVSDARRTDRTLLVMCAVNCEKYVMGSS